MSRPCANCGAEVPDGASICDNCGMPVSASDPGRDAPEREPARTEAPRREAPPPPEVPTRETPARRQGPLSEPGSAAPSPPPAASPAAQSVERRRVPTTRRRGWPILLVLLLLLLLGIGLAAWFLLPSLGGGAGGLQVPDVVGMSQVEAEDALGAAGFETTVVTGEGAAGEVLEQSPSAGTEAEEGSTVTITVGEEPEGPDYSEVSDGPFTAEVPAGWASVTGADSEAAETSWSAFLGGEVGASITSAPDLSAWGPSATTGAYMVASKTLAEGYTNEDLVISGPNDMSAVCTQGAAQDFDMERNSFNARVQAWSDCNGNPDSYFYSVAAAPEDRECVVVLKLAGLGETERELAENTIDTFDVDCGALPA